MDRYKETFETWDKVASLYQDKFMNLDIYRASSVTKKPSNIKTFKIFSINHLQGKQLQNVSKYVILICIKIMFTEPAEVSHMLVSVRWVLPKRCEILVFQEAKRRHFVRRKMVPIVIGMAFWLDSTLLLAQISTAYFPCYFFSSRKKT